MVCLYKEGDTTGITFCYQTDVSERGRKSQTVTSNRYDYRLTTFVYKQIIILSPKAPCRVFNYKSVF